jgi:outer membrane protein assembly factor BamD (BamD/ComL family)
MAARSAGRNAEAATLLARFIARYPGDPHAQDAAYVRVLCLRAAGQNEAMRSAARDYLRAHPNGFRRAEIEALDQ